MSSENFPASLETPAKTIDEVIDQLTSIIAWAEETNSRTGYFAALYRKVTIRVKQGIGDRLFDDGPRMERLDVIFANRFIQAFFLYNTGQTPTHAWGQAFDTVRRWWPVVLQHLLMGINAHINLDLGIAAAQTISPGQLQDLKGDFEKINQILADLVGSVQEEMARIWPVVGILNRYLGSVEKAIINFSLEKARDEAWSFAAELAPLTEELLKNAVREKDRDIAEFSTIITRPGMRYSILLRMIRLGERGSIHDRIGVLK